MKSRLVTGLVCIQTMLALFGGAGCCTPRPVGEKVAIAAARREASHRGWKRITVHSSRFVDGRWLVAIVRRPLKVVSSSAVVEVSPHGRVLGFYCDVK